MTKMKSAIVFVLLCLGMGMSMPSCPAQQALQQQVDTLQASSTEMHRKVQTLTGQVNALTADMNQVKQLLPQMTNVVQAQKGALEQLDKTVKELQSKSSHRNKKR